MYAIEFLANISNNRIEIPKKYRKRLHKKVRVILLSEEYETKSGEQSSIQDILNKVPGQQLFQTAEEVDRFLNDERALWDH